MLEIKWYNSENELMVTRKFASTSRPSSQGIKSGKQIGKSHKMDFTQNSYLNKMPSQQTKYGKPSVTKK